MEAHSPLTGPLLFDVEEGWTGKGDGRGLVLLQPKVVLATGLVCSHEVFVRPPGYTDSAEGFYRRLARLPLPQRLPLEMQILRVAVEAVKAEVPLALNVSAPMLLWREGRDFLEAVLRERAAQLTLELLETDQTEPEALAQPIERLARHGARIALDDFGKGYSSLSLALALPVLHEIKLDRAVVCSPRADDALPALVELGARLGVEVTAEHVDSPAVDARVRTHGVTCGQGFFYGTPTPVAAWGQASWTAEVEARAEQALRA